MAKIYSTTGQTSLSWRGQGYTADENGVFDVPEEALPDLAPFGLIPGEPTPATSTGAPNGNPSQWTTEALQAEALRLGVDATLPRPDLIKAVAQAIKAQA